LHNGNQIIDAVRVSALFIPVIYVLTDIVPHLSEKGYTLIALAYSIYFKSILEKNLWEKSPSQVVFIALMFAATIASLVFLYQARLKLWREYLRV